MTVRDATAPGTVEAVKPQGYKSLADMILGVATKSGRAIGFPNDVIFSSILMALGGFVAMNGTEEADAGAVAMVQKDFATIIRLVRAHKGDLEKALADLVALEAPVDPNQRPN